MSEEISARIRDLENSLTSLKNGKLRETVAVFEGLKSAHDTEAAKKFLTDKLKEKHVTLPSDIYYKGSEFNGLLFAKFSSMAERDTAVEVFRNGKYTCGDFKVWAKIDKPIEGRVPETFLFALKKILISWGFDRKDVRVEIDTADKHIIVEGKKIISANVKDGTFTPI